jgi:tripartite-type tricarboxylate transporter receptor subunit TctC
VNCSGGAAVEPSRRCPNVDVYPALVRCSLASGNQDDLDTICSAGSVSTCGAHPAQRRPWRSAGRRTGDDAVPGNAATLAINPALFDKVPYNTLKDFQPIARYNFSQNVLVVRTGLPVQNVRELIDYALRNPGKLSYGSPDTGTSVHLAAELFQQMTGTKMVHVPYKAITQATAEMIAGQIDLMFDNLTSIGPHIKAGKVRALGMTGLTRTPLFPEVPTIAEAGIPKFEVNTWGGVIGPVGLPAPIVARLNEAILRSCETAALKERLSLVGNQCVGGTPREFTAFLRAELAKWADIVKKSGAKPD